MRVLLVEPQYRKSQGAKDEANGEYSPNFMLNRIGTRNDDTLWYPPLGLLKLARFHKNRGDEVLFVNGCDRKVAALPDLLKPDIQWDRVYITTLFTFHWENIVKTIAFYKEVAGGTVSKVFVGGIMASLMAEELFEETGIYPVTGVLHSPSQIGMTGSEDIDLLAPDYAMLNPTRYAINDTYYGYTSRGCVNRCLWCGVPRIEPEYVPYIDIKPMIHELREEFGDKPRLKLMDNNVLASKDLERIVMDLEELGYSRKQYTKTTPPKQRVVDFNQGLDASFLDEKRMKLIARLNVKPMRIAFDRASEKKQYVQALLIAQKYGVRDFSNYLLYNWKDSPRDLYDRLVVNIQQNEKWGKGHSKKPEAEIYSYPMRFAPINSNQGDHANRHRDAFREDNCGDRKWMESAVWTRRFIRNIEVMKGAAHGAISPTPSLAWRTVGKSYEEFLANLYMPEELLRNRNKHEYHVHLYEPARSPGTGKVEEFRAFILKLLKKGDDRFRQFHNAVSESTVDHIRKAIRHCSDEEMREWLRFYIKN